MARISAERAWYFGQITQEFDWTVAQQTDIAILLGFDDVEFEGGNGLTRERSQWYTERIILWGHVTWIPISPTSLKARLPTFARLGQLDDTQDMELTQVAPSFAADLFGRIYQEEWRLCFRNGLQVYDGGALIVNSGESTADSAQNTGGFTPDFFKWDISVKSRVQEGASIVLQYGSSEDLFADTGDHFIFHGAYKILFRRGK